MLISGLFKICIQNVTGILIDKISSQKRSLVVLANSLVALPCLLLFMIPIPNFSILLISMCLMSLGEAIAFPALYAIVKEIVSIENWEMAVSASEQYNHLGTYFYMLYVTVSR